MPRMRSRGDVCQRCFSAMSITANLDERQVIAVKLPDNCLNKGTCHERLSHDIFDEPFDQGQKEWK